MERKKKLGPEKKLRRHRGSEGTKVPMANNITTDQKDSNTQFVPYHCAGKQIFETLLTIMAVLCMAEELMAFLVLMGQLIAHCDLPAKLSEDESVAKSCRLDFGMRTIELVVLQSHWTFDLLANI